jgi:hypothetical protein
MSHALTYDTFPPHSNLRREIVGDGITITAAAEEPNPQVRRVQLQRAAFSGALLSGALLAAFILAIASTYVAHRRYMDAPLFAALVIAFIVFCGAMFAFIWRVQYAARIDALERALRQTTILAATPGKLLIETAGPFGQASYELLGFVENESRSVVDFRRGRCGGGRPVDCLEIVLADGKTIHVLPGRDEAELRWVVRTLRGAVGI